MVDAAPDTAEVEWSLHGVRCLVDPVPPRLASWFGRALRVELEVGNGDLTWRLQCGSCGLPRRRRRLRKLAWSRIEGDWLGMWFVDQPGADWVSIGGASAETRRWLLQVIQPLPRSQRPSIPAMLRALHAIHQPRRA